MGGERAVAPVVGATLLFAISVMLVGAAAMGVTSIAESTSDATVVHGEGRFVLDLAESGTTAIEVRPKVVFARGSTFRLSIEGTEVHQWGGTSAVTVTCVAPGDEIAIHTTKAGTRERFQSWTVTERPDCGLPASQRDDHAVVEGTTVSLDG